MSPRRTFRFLLIAFGISAASAMATAQTRDTSIPEAIGDLNAAQLVEVRDMNGRVLLHGTLKTESNKPKEIEREADLADPEGGKGEGELEIEMERKEKKGMTETKDEIELEVKHLPSLTQCEVFIDGLRVGAFVTSKAGKGEFELERKSAGW